MYVCSAYWKLSKFDSFENITWVLAVLLIIFFFVHFTKAGGMLDFYDLQILEIQRSLLIRDSGRLIKYRKLESKSTSEYCDDAYKVIYFPRLLLPIKEKCLGVA